MHKVSSCGSKHTCGADGVRGLQGRLRGDRPLQQLRDAQECERIAASVRQRQRLAVLNT